MTEETFHWISRYQKHFFLSFLQQQEDNNGMCLQEVAIANRVPKIGEQSLVIREPCWHLVITETWERGGDGRTDVELEASWTECPDLVCRGILAALPPAWLSGLTWGDVLVCCTCLLQLLEEAWAAERGAGVCGVCHKWILTYWQFQASQNAEPIFLSNNEIGLQISFFCLWLFLFVHWIFRAKLLPVSKLFSATTTIHVLC